MTTLPVLKRKAFEKVLISMGFVRIAQQKNHALFKHEDGRMTVLPYYRSKNLAFALLKLILNDLKLSDEDYCSMVNSL